MYVHPSSRPFIACLIALLWLLLHGCAPSEKLRTGDEAFRVKKYMKAAELYQKELEKAESEYERSELTFRIGECYEYAHKIDRAERWFKKAMEMSYGSVATYAYAEMLKRNEKYEQAIEYFERYGKESPGTRLRARKAIYGCRLALRWRSNNASYDIENQRNINTISFDHLPTFYEDNKVVYSSQRKEATGEYLDDWTGEKFSDLFVADVEERDNLFNARRFDETGLINTQFHEGVSCFSVDGNEIYFTRCGSEGKRDDYCQIYWSRRLEDGTWQKPQRVPLFHDSLNVGHPSLSQNGRFLYFSAETPGGYGGKDIYYAEWTLDGWSDPVNLGPDINTDKHEMFPFILNDTTLYFSSDGHVNTGGLDLFVAIKRGRVWKVRNLQYPLNSGGDDFGIAVRSHDKVNDAGYFTDVGYFSSSRPDGKGQDDIYKFVMRKPVFIELEVNVYKKILEDPNDPYGEVAELESLPEANVQLFYQNAEGDSVTESNLTPEGGQVEFDLFPETDYQIKASKQNYFTRSRAITTRKYKGLNKLHVRISVDLVLDSIMRDQEIVIRNIYYDLDKANIREDATAPLDTLAELLRENPTIRLEIASHTDSRGSAEYNIELSQRRAQSVVNYLVSGGIDEDRLIPKGYGQTQLLNHCEEGVECTEEEHQRNRRTSFRVIGVDQQIESVEPDDIFVDPEAIRKAEEEQRKQEEEERRKREEQERLQENDDLLEDDSYEPGQNE